MVEEPRRRHFGYRRWRAVLRRKRALVVNHKRLRRLLREMGLSQPRIRHRGRIQTPRPNEPMQANTVWQVDMTKVPIAGGGWLHHIAVIDVYTREIVGHYESLRARASEWLEAVNQAILERFPEGSRGGGLVLQADNGCQPRAKSFLDALRVCGVRPAFIDVAEPKQNAFIERYFRSLKEEEVWPNIYETVEQAKQGIADFVRFYNHEREHSSLNYVPPAHYGRAASQTLHQNVAELVDRPGRITMGLASLRLPRTSRVKVASGGCSSSQPW